MQNVCSLRKSKAMVFRAGYTLVELAMAMLVIGLIIAGAATAYNIYVREQAVSITSANTSRIAQALGNYLAENGRYPCPAAIDLDPDNPKYGMEVDCVNLTGYDASGNVTAAVAAGNFGGGIWVEESLKPDVDYNEGTGNPPDMRKLVVVRGAVPFRVLNMSADPEETSYDGYRNRIVYAVTTKLAGINTYRTDHGGIEIRDGNGASVLGQPNSAHFIIISPGPDHRGAYTKQGKLRTACGAASAGRDTENCNTTGQAVYSAAQVADKSGANHFDDLPVYSSSVDTPFWKVADDNRTNVHDVAGDKQIAIGKTPDADADPEETKLDISGDMQAKDSEVAAEMNTNDEKGNILADKYCDRDNADCFEPSTIAGPETPAMRCGDAGDSGPYATGIEDEQVKCAPVARFTCPEGTFISGVGAPDPDNPSGSGAVMCIEAEELPSLNKCPPMNVTGCAGRGPFALPEGVEGERKTILVGFSMLDTYECRRRTNGTYQWRYMFDNSPPGVCECNPVTDEHQVYQCDPYGDGTYTGTYTHIVNRTCDGGVAVEHIDYYAEDNCVCTPRPPRITTEACPSGWTGQRTFQETWICTAPNDGEWSAETEVSNTCVCTPETREETLTCPGGLPGHIKRARTSICPADPDDPITWGPYTVIENTCVCTEKDESRPISCPIGTAGTAVERRHFTCPSATWTSWTEDNSGCACSATTEERDFACETGYIGTIRKARDYTCPGPVAGPWTEISRNCTPITYKWRALGTPSGSGFSGWGPEVGTNCSPQGSTSSCHKTISGGGGLVDNYSDCICQ